MTLHRSRRGLSFQRRRPVRCNLSMSHAKTRKQNTHLFAQKSFGLLVRFLCPKVLGKKWPTSSRFVPGKSFLLAFSAQKYGFGGNVDRVVEQFGTARTQKVSPSRETIIWEFYAAKSFLLAFSARKYGFGGNVDRVVEQFGTARTQKVSRSTETIIWEVRNFLRIALLYGNSQNDSRQNET